MTFYAQRHRIAASRAVIFHSIISGSQKFLTGRLIVMENKICGPMTVNIDHRMSTELRTFRSNTNM